MFHKNNELIERIKILERDNKEKDDIIAKLTNMSNKDIRRTPPEKPKAPPLKIVREGLW